MSALPNKRLHEESRTDLHDDLGAQSSGRSKLMPLASNEYHASNDVGQDHMPMIAYAGRRSLLDPIAHRSSSFSDLNSNHPGGGSESRLDFKDWRDSKRDLKLETFHATTESKDSYVGAKLDKDVHFEIRGDISKEINTAEHTGRRSPLDPTSWGSLLFTDLDSDCPGGGSESRLDYKDPNGSKRDHKFEADNAKTNSKNSYLGAKVDKDIKFEIRGDVNKEWKTEKVPFTESENFMKLGKDAYGGASRDLNSPGKDVDPSLGSRTIVHGPAEVGNEGLNSEDKDHLEVRKAVEESKIDLKGEDKLKDKDTERKEGKHRKRQNKDLMKGEGDAERWGKERKVLSQDKGSLEVGGKDGMKKVAQSGAEKESLPNEKDTVDLSGSAVEQESLASKLKKQKDHESWKNVDKDGRNRKKDINGEVEGERPNKRSKYRHKESDEGVDAEGGTERKKEAFNYGVQQRKRMLQRRISNSRFRSLSLENEGSEVKPDVSTIVYGDGECMEALIELWEEYKSSQASGVSGSSQNGPTQEIRIPAEHVCTSNPQVRGGQLWGTDVYTYDSDIVAVLMHTGYFHATSSPPPSTILELRATIRVLPPQNCYVSTSRNNIRSRPWGAAVCCSYRVEKCCIVKKGGGTIDLDPVQKQSSHMELTFAPEAVSVEQKITTGPADSNASPEQTRAREVIIQFNQCQEPWLRYRISVVADKGLEKPLFTSSRLKKGEVLYLENDFRRYELCFDGPKPSPATEEHETESDASHVTAGENMDIDVFRWSRCKKALPQKRMLSIGIPMPLEHVEVLEDNLEWEDIEWSSTGVVIAGRAYHIARVIFLSQS